MLTAKVLTPNTDINMRNPDDLRDENDRHGLIRQHFQKAIPVKAGIQRGGLSCDLRSKFAPTSFVLITLLSKITQ